MMISSIISATQKPVDGFLIHREFHMIGLFLGAVKEHDTVGHLSTLSVLVSIWFLCPSTMILSILCRYFTLDIACFKCENSSLDGASGKGKGP